MPPHVLGRRLQRLRPRLRRGAPFLRLHLPGPAVKHLRLHLPPRRRERLLPNIDPRLLACTLLSGAPPLLGRVLDQHRLVQLPTLRRLRHLPPEIGQLLVRLGVGCPPLVPLRRQRRLRGFRPVANRGQFARVLLLDLLGAHLEPGEATLQLGTLLGGLRLHCRDRALLARCLALECGRRRALTRCDLLTMRRRHGSQLARDLALQRGAPHRGLHHVGLRRDGR